jgi:hypothetical protein
MAKFEFGFDEIWFRLIIKNLPDHPDLFVPKNTEKAQTILRAGKLKVVAAKAWAESAGIIEKKKKYFALSRLGEMIAKNDPEFEENGIWWMIHYNLARKVSPAWFYAFYFNLFEPDIFDRAEFEREVREWWDLNHDKPMTDSVFDKLIFSPFKQVFELTRLGEEFGLLAINETGSYSRRTPSVVTVHPAIFAYALLDWAGENARQSVHFEKLMEPWGVGRIFRLSHESLDRLIVDIGERYDKQVAWISHTANLNSVSLMDVPPLALISAYYHELDGLDPKAALERGISEIHP